MRLRRGHHRAVAVLAFAALAGGVAVGASGCGTGAIDPVAQAATTSSSVAGYRTAFTERISTPALGRPLTATGSGYVDERQHAATLAFAFDTSQIPGAAALGGGNLDFHLVFKGLVLYMKVPAAIASHIPGGKTWLSIDVGQAAKTLGVNLAGLSDPSTSNPAQFLDYLRAESGHVVKLGTDSVRGVPTTHYRASIDLSRLPNAVPSAQRAQAQAAAASIERATGIKTLPIDVWVDSQHLVRRERFSIDQNGAAGHVTALVTADLFDFGSQPAVTVPPRDQVFDASSLVTAAAARGSATPPTLGG